MSDKRIRDPTPTSNINRAFGRRCHTRTYCSSPTMSRILYMDLRQLVGRPWPIFRLISNVAVKLTNHITSHVFRLYLKATCMNGHYFPSISRLDSTYSHLRNTSPSPRQTLLIAPKPLRYNPLDAKHISKPSPKDARICISGGTQVPPRPRQTHTHL